MTMWQTLALSSFQGTMVTTSTTSRSVEIDATAEQVYAFVNDLEKLMGSVPSIRRLIISDVYTSTDGATTYTWTTTVRIGPLSRDVHGSTTREQCVPNQRLTYRHAMGLQTVETFMLQPTSTGTRLNFTVSASAPVPFLDRLVVLVASKGKGQAHYVDQVLAEIKHELETGRDARSAGPATDP
jgi:carbon monoxide dehydrogenase subunit G